MRISTDRHVVIVGMMGSGKSSVGRALADATGWPLHDNDTLLSEVAGMTARELLEGSGVDALRDAEERALLAGLALPPPVIVDAAAGTITSATLRGRLLEHFVVWLRAAPEVLFERSAGGAHRPWLDRGAEWFRTTAQEREPLFESVADLVIDTDHRQPADVANEVFRILQT